MARGAHAVFRWLGRALARPVLFVALGTVLLSGVGGLPPGLQAGEAPAVAVEAVREAASGQAELVEGGRLVLRYNHRTIEPGRLLEDIAAGNLIYARARSDYIHPLHGPGGEVLTRDWPVDHPHHRGLYWAWPEVDWGAERGDLHALQRVFARPSGAVRFGSGPGFAEIVATNLWLWEDRDPIVRERVVIRAHRATEEGRLVDLQFEFLGLQEAITVARRGTSNYGGLNLRLATPQDQRITLHTDPPDIVPRRAWSDLSGVFPGAATASGLSLLQHRDNPGYPADWVQYPELSWVQPAFPSPGTRHPLPPGRPLVLRYRLLVHPGGTPPPTTLARLWDAWHACPGAADGSRGVPGSAAP